MDLNQLDAIQFLGAQGIVWWVHSIDILFSTILFVCFITILFFI